MSEKATHLLTLLLCWTFSEVAAFDIVSVDSNGEQGDLDSFSPSISQNGRRIVFLSRTQFVPEDTDTISDIYLHDRDTGTTTLISIGFDGIAANDHCTFPLISADGSRVIFRSTASNLVGGASGGTALIYLRDVAEEKTILVSADENGAPANNHCHSGSISGDGQRVAFSSTATNLVPEGATDEQVYLWETDKVVGVVSTDSEGDHGSDPSFYPEISADGVFVVFTSDADDLVDDDDNNDYDVFRKNIETGEILRVSVSLSGGDSDGEAEYTYISADGRYVSFWSDAIDLVPPDPNAGDFAGIYVRDLDTGVTTRVSVDTNGNPPLPGVRYTVEGGWISGDGKKVLFVTDAFGPGAGTPASVTRLYEYSLLTGVSRLVDKTHTGGDPNAKAQTRANISLDGNWIAYGSAATNISYTDTNGDKSDVFVSPGTPRAVPSATDPFAALRAQLANKIKKLKKKAKTAKKKGQVGKAKKLKSKIKKLSKRLKSL